MQKYKFIRYPNGYVKENFLFHFTDKRNLPSIENEGGILSKTEIDRRKIQNVFFGGNELSHRLDEHSGISDYISLCCIPEHPMEYVARQDGRISEAVYLRISFDVFETPGILFCSSVANSNEARLLDPKEALGEIDFSVAFEFHDWNDPDVRARRDLAKKIEVLVPKIIPLNMIQNPNG